MARTARIDLPDHWYHIIARGQRRETMFFTTQDYTGYLGILEEQLTLYGARLAAYCLMPNHVHLIVYREAVTLGKIFHQVNMYYALYFNRVHAKTGSVFQGRFKSYIIDTENYLNNLVRYIHRNPVRAEIVADAREYPWSSDGFYRSGTSTMPLVSPPGYEGKAGRKRYCELMRGDHDDEVKVVRQVIGSEHFAEQISRQSRQKAEEFARNDRRQRTALRQRAEELIAESGWTIADMTSLRRDQPLSNCRQRIMSQLYAEYHFPEEIGKIFRRTASAVINAARRHKKKTI